MAETDTILKAERSNPSQSRSRKRVASILDAATVVLSEIGYNNLTMRSIAIEADVKQTSLYRYWPNKQAIIEDLIDRFIDEQAVAIGACHEMVDEGHSLQDMLFWFMNELRLSIDANKWIIGIQVALISDPVMKPKDAFTQSHFAKEFGALLFKLGIGADEVESERLGRMTTVFLDAYIMSLGRRFEPSQETIQTEYITAISNYLAPHVKA